MKMHIYNSGTTNLESKFKNSCGLLSPIFYHRATVSEILGQNLLKTSWKCNGRIWLRSTRTHNKYLSSLGKILFITLQHTASEQGLRRNGRPTFLGELKNDHHKYVTIFISDLGLCCLFGTGFSGCQWGKRGGGSKGGGERCCHGKDPGKDAWKLGVIPDSEEIFWEGMPL